MSLISVNSLVGNRWGSLASAEDGLRLADLVLQDSDAILDFTRVKSISSDFAKAFFRRLGQTWGLENVRSKLTFTGLSQGSEGHFFRFLSAIIEEDIHRHPDWQPGRCRSCAGTLPKRPGGQRYCSYECKVAAWEMRGRPGGSPPEGHSYPYDQTWVYRLKEARVNGVKPSPDMLLKAVSDLVIENQVLKREVELLRAQLDYLKGERVSLKNSRGYQPADLLTVEESAEYLKIAKSTLNSWRSTGEHQIAYTKVGRSIRYRVADLDAFLFRSERAFASREKS